MPDLHHVVRTAAWLLPASSGKNRLLQRLGDEVDRSAVIAPTIVWRVGRIRVGAGSRIGYGNQFRNLRAVTLGHHVRIGRRNVVSSHPVYARLYPDGARFDAGPHAVITDRHHLDGAGGLLLGEFAMLGGTGTQVLTHSIDLARDVQAAYPVTVGARSFVGGGALLLGGAVLPPKSLLTSGSVLIRSRAEPVSAVWHGAPANPGEPVSDRWFTRTDNAEPPIGPESDTDGSTDRAIAPTPRRRGRSGAPRPIDVARALGWLLPASARKNALLRRLGHDIHPSARATPNLVWRVDQFTMAEGSRIAELNRLTGLRRVTLGQRSTMGRWNQVHADPDSPPRAGALCLGDHAMITGRHLVDATGGVTIGAFAAVAGRECALLSDGSDDDDTGPAPIRVGARSFVGTRCRLTAGAVLADRSVLAAGSTLTALSVEEMLAGVWAGTPARHRRPVQGRWFDRDQTATRRVYLPDSGDTIEDAF